jgi:hypothetical protein
MADCDTLPIVSELIARVLNGIEIQAHADIFLLGEDACASAHLAVSPLAECEVRGSGKGARADGRKGLGSTDRCQMARYELIQLDPWILGFLSV